MDTTPLRTIAWLIPVPGNRWAVDATRMPANNARRVDLDPLASNLDDIPEEAEEEDSLDYPSDKENDENETCVSSMFPRAGLSLSFNQKPKGARGFLIGTDPKTCDIVLPRIRGISRRHAYITFDSEKRPILRDTSKHGTAVWYDGHSNGDRRRASWVLGPGFSYGFPAMVSKIVIDIQGVRFQVVVNELLPQLDEYQDLVDDFLFSVAPSPLPAFPSTAGRSSTVDLVPAPLRVPRSLLVKHEVPSEDGLQSDTYLWNAARPWEPLVKFTE